MSEEREEGPTLTEVKEKQISIDEMPAIIPQEEKLQEQNKKIEESQEKSSVRKKKQKRRVITYLSYISKEVEKNGN
jgi:hypothetical protein